MRHTRSSPLPLRLPAVLSAMLMTIAGGGCDGCSAGNDPGPPRSDAPFDLVPDAGLALDAALDHDPRGDLANELGPQAPDGGDARWEAGVDVEQDADDADAVGEVGAAACPPSAPVRPGYAVFRCSAVARWEIHDLAAYQESKEGIEEIAALLDTAYPAIEARLGRPLPLPLRVVITPGECCGSFTGDGHIGYNVGDFQSPQALDWTRGVLLSDVVNAVVASVARGWPQDWWSGSSHFTAMVVSDVLYEIAGDGAATAWETQETLQTFPLYRALVGLLGEIGWTGYSSFLGLVVDDAMDWTPVGENPSALRTNYVLAYLSLAAGRSVAADFQGAQLQGVDATVIEAVADARTRLKRADLAGKDIASAWAAFRSGNYQQALQDF